jgi:hypothetical protein
MGRTAHHIENPAAKKGEQPDRQLSISGSRIEKQQQFPMRQAGHPTACEKFLGAVWV